MVSATPNHVKKISNSANEVLVDTTHKNRNLTSVDHPSPKTPIALRAEGPPHKSLGRRPREGAPEQNKGCKPDTKPTPKTDRFQSETLLFRADGPAYTSPGCSPICAKLVTCACVFAVLAYFI